jgi:hypothetical protein
MADRLDVNEHYLNRVVAAAETAGVEATEDIVTGNGIKLVAKGARIDAKVKDRLLQYKLRKPLESSLRVIDGTSIRPLDRIAEKLIEQHAFLAGICGAAAARLIATALRGLQLSTPLESLLSVYAMQGDAKLDHAVGVSLLAAAMGHDLPHGGSNGVHALMVAGLLHDVGELYIDPAILAAPTRLSSEQWKHVATHPIVAAHLLRDLPGAGSQVADAVLYHHERLDGFGYPQGVSGARLPVSGQVVAMAEMLIGLIESGNAPGERASVAVKLIPGEFHRHLLDRVVSAAKAAALGAIEGQALTAAQADELARKAAGLGASLQQMRQMRPDIEAQIASGSAALKDLMAHVLERCQRIRLAYSSTGLDTHESEALRDHLVQMGPRVHFEIGLVLREIEWRLREVAREVRVRAGRLPPGEAALVRQFIERSKAVARQAKASHAVDAPTKSELA